MSIFRNDQVFGGGTFLQIYGPTFLTWHFSQCPASKHGFASKKRYLSAKYRNLQIFHANKLLESDNFINPASFGSYEVIKLRKVNWNRILLVAILILLIFEIVLHLAFQKKPNESLPDLSSQHTLYLPAVPIQFVHENPDCTNKLLDAMNLTNVHIGNAS